MRAFLKLMIILVIIGAGVLIALMLVRTRPQAERKPISVGTPTVTAVTVNTTDVPVEITTMGTVVPARQVTLQPQVAGHIVQVNPHFVPGGRFEAGEMVLRIDDRDYRIAVEQQKANVAQSLVNLKTEQGRQTVARREWELLGPDIRSTPEGQELALRKPQLESAEAALASARAALKKAELDLSRTVVEAPFNSFVQEKRVDLGQFVTTGTPLVTLAGTDTFWVRIAVPVDTLPHIAIPGVNGNRQGSAATVIQNAAGEGARVLRQGQVVRLLGDVDPAGRMARILVAVDDPLGLNDNGAEKLPLLLESYVRVEVEGPVLADVVVIPRQALRENNVVWTVTPDGQLAIRDVTVAWRTKETVMVRGLTDSAQVITSRIPAPVPGMALRIDEAGTVAVETPAELEEVRP